MFRKGFWWTAALVLAVAAAAGLIAVAEHPEHPSSKKRGKVTMEALGEAIEEYVAGEAALKGGYFLVYDAQAGEALMLTLQKVHKERLAKVGKYAYFACADFETPEGKVYDLDIFMEGRKTKDLEVTQITVHKEEGVARYTWYKEGKVWKMRPAPGAEGVGEHPDKEHPDKEHPKAEHPKAEHPTSEHPN